jgi:hypothetical protein
MRASVHRVDLSDTSTVGRSPLFSLNLGPQQHGAYVVHASGGGGRLYAQKEQETHLAAFSSCGYPIWITPCPLSTPLTGLAI